MNECYFAVKGAALVLPHDECMHVYKSLSKTATSDIQKHLQSMFFLLRPEDTLKMVLFFITLNVVKCKNINKIFSKIRQ